MLTPRSITRTALPLFLGSAVTSVAFTAVSPALGVVVAIVLTSASTLWLGRRLRREADRIRENAGEVSEEFRPVIAGYQVQQEISRQEQLRLEEKRLQLEVLLEGMQDGVLGVDAARRVEWTNAEMKRILDRHGLGAAIRLGRSLAHTLRDPALLEVVEQAIEQRSPASLRSSTLLPGRSFEVNAAPLPDGGAVLVLRDVTRAEALEQTQRDFVANVSHELRTPLTSVRGYTETILDSGLIAPEAEPWLDIVLKNVERMSRLTEDLLILARTEAPDRKVIRRPIPASTLVEDAVRTFHGQVNEDAVELIVEQATNLPVLVDEIAMLQVLGNLLENAAKYGRSQPNSPARITVSAAPVSGDENGPSLIEFQVRDFGPGIAMEHHGRIFERFYRIDKARSRESGGTGLGLAIARYLVEENGGTISLHSSLGKGAEFRFTLPAATDAEEAASGPPAEAIGS